MLPTAFTSDLDLALQAVRAHPEHVLNPGYRWLIWTHLGPRAERTRPWADLGHRRRALLAIAGAQQVLPLWTARWPRRPEPVQALAAAGDYLDGGRGADECWRIADRARETVNEVICEDFALSYAGESAIEALRATIDDEFFKPGERNLDWVDGQLGGDDNDAASAAAIALGGVAGNATHDSAGIDTGQDPGAGLARRLAFWEWWLDQAVPNAYRDGTSPPGPRAAGLSPRR